MNQAIKETTYKSLHYAVLKQAKAEGALILAKEITKIGNFNNGTESGNFDLDGFRVQLLETLANVDHIQKFTSIMESALEVDRLKNKTEWIEGKGEKCIG